MDASVLRKIETEIARLRSLYLTTLYSFKQSAKAIVRDIRSGELQPQAPIILDPRNPEGASTSSNVHGLLHKINSQFPRYLREISFVRLISALEVFLIDVVREVFLARRDLFHSEQRIEFSFGEILSAETITDLWTKLMNRELRKLQNQGFKEIIKFYKNRFNIDLNNSSIPLASIQEFHDRRHILVHRLGRAGDEYRHRYNSTLKNLSVTEDYLLDAFQVISEFVQFVTTAAQAKIDEGKIKSEPQHDEAEVRLVLEILTNAAEVVTDRDFHFSIEDRIVSLGDILISYQYEQQRQVLILAGNSNNVRAYLKIIKKLERKNDLIVYEREYIRQAPIVRHICKLPNDVVESIAKSLPKRPWPLNIHKDVAQKFGVSNTQAYAAIDAILHDDRLSSMVGTGDQG